METASLTPQLPRPESGLRTLVELGLLVEGADELMRPSPLLVIAAAATVTPPDHLPPGLRGVVLERLLAIEGYGDAIREVLGYATIQAVGVRVPWRALPASVQASPAWLWLQELGLAEHDGEMMILDDVLRGISLDSELRTTSMSQAELEARIAAQRERAWLTEDVIVELERKRLAEGNVPEYGEAVHRVSIEDALAGYDVASFEVDGSPRLIEVKCSAGPRLRFFLSRNERDLAERTGPRYWLAWVGWASRLPAGPCDVSWFQDPARIWNNSDGPWQVTYEDAVVSRVGDDSPVRSNP